jgi:hypothetical protein
MNPSWFSFNRRTDRRFEIETPTERNNASSQGDVDWPPAFATRA